MRVMTATGICICVANIVGLPLEPSPKRYRNSNRPQIMMHDVWWRAFVAAAFSLPWTPDTKLYPPVTQRGSLKSYPEI
jgi:hypothetical protein